MLISFANTFLEMLIFIIKILILRLLCHKPDCKVLWNLCIDLLLASDPKVNLFK